jgi:hypothetical protein
VSQRGVDLVTTAAEPGRGVAVPILVRYLVLAAACSLVVLTSVQRQGFMVGSREEQAFVRHRWCDSLPAQ